jgi:hypothetical protein
VADLPHSHGERGKGDYSRPNTISVHDTTT